MNITWVTAVTALVDQIVQSANQCLLEIPQSETSLKSRSVDAVRVAVTLTLVDFDKEIANIAIPINDQALDQIYNDKIILVYGRNLFVLQFSEEGVKFAQEVLSDNCRGVKVRVR